MSCLALIGVNYVAPADNQNLYLLQRHSLLSSLCYILTLFLLSLMVIFT